MEGDEHARFTQMYERYYPRVLGYAARRVALDQAREVADETFLVAWRKLSDIPETAVLPWLLVVARNTIVDQVRRGRRRDALALELARCVEAVNQPGADVIAVERMTVLGALARLPDRDREALMLTVWDGLTNREAAAAMGCSPATFAVRLHRARRRLATAMARLDNHHQQTPKAVPRPPVPRSVPEGSSDEQEHQVRA